MGRKLFGFLLICVCVYYSTSKSIDPFKLVETAITEYTATKLRPSYLTYALEQLPLSFLFQPDSQKVTLKDAEYCTLCSVVAQLLILERKLGMTNVQLTAEASYFCTLLNIQNERVCEGVIKPNVDIFVYLVDNTKDLSASRICGLLLPDKNCYSGSNYEWTIDIPSGTTVDKAKANATDTFKVLHISDIHYDPRYTPGKSSQCGEPLCCQDDQADGTDATNSCGYWSEYVSGDTPLQTVEAVFKQMATHEFDYIYYTGDTVRHRVWSTSVDNNTNEIMTIAYLFQKYFDVPVFTALGNHEPHPVNAWSSDGVDDDSVSTQWLFDLAAERWGDWLTDEAKETILKGGYYTISPKKGLRVVVLNNNVCYTENWWLINDSKDPYGQLAWLVEVLVEAEENGESVHVLMHMPTGTGSCLKSWSREFRRILSRFANTVTGHFTGHSHKDEFWVYYDSSDSSKAISVSWNGASLNTDKSNPSYKIYEIDGETFDVLDFEEWTFNLTAANLDSTKDLEWYKLYSFKDAFGVDSLEPSDVDDLVVKMTEDHSLLQKYYIYKYRNSDYAVDAGCNESCEKDLLCNMVNTMNGDTTRCEELKNLYEENL